MPVPPARRTRVLLGNLEPLVLLGMDRVLTQEGFDVKVGKDADGFVALVRQFEPDAVVLDLDGRGSRDLTAQVRDTSPETKVILWARDEEVMEVLDPGSSLPRTISSSVPEVLRSELNYQASPQVED